MILSICRKEKYHSEENEVCRSVYLMNGLELSSFPFQK